jgi:hypothetical protein
VEGIGACMAIRRSTWEVLGGFDEMLGAGAPFRSAEDSDFALRTLLSGAYVFESPAIAVTHYGFRTWAEGRPLIDGYMYGLGATYAKLLRCGRAQLLVPLGHLAWRWLFGRPVVDLNQVPPRVPRVSAFLRGMLAGARAPIDPRGRKFIARGARPSALGIATD